MRFYQLIIIIFIIATIFLFFCAFSMNEWKILFAWVRKDLYIAYFDIGYKEFKLPWKCGFEIFMTKSEMINDEYILAVIKKFKITLLAGLISALIISLAVNFYILLLTQKQIQETTALKDTIAAKDEKIKNLTEKLNALSPKEQPKFTTNKISLSEGF